MVARNKVVIDGSFTASGASSPIERWTTGFHYGLPGGGAIEGPSNLQQFANSLANWLQDLENFGAFLPQALTPQSRIDAVSVYEYPASGPAVAVARAEVTGAVGTGTPQRPPQCAFVATLDTGLAGRSRRGRMYWPFIGGAINTTLGIPTASAQALSGDIAGFLSFANVAFDVDTYRVCVYSAVQDALTTVRSVRVGNVIDTQRRRREDLLESYVSTAVVVPDEV